MVPCTPVSVRSIYIGDHNMDRRIAFADGISWVARLRLPQLKEVFGGREVLDVASILEVEIASMKFLEVCRNWAGLERVKTYMPVLEVHSYSLIQRMTLEPRIFRWVISMEQLRQNYERQGNVLPVCKPDQNRKSREQMAGVLPRYHGSRSIRLEASIKMNNPSDLFSSA